MTALFLSQTACLEGFEMLITRVAYDPAEQRFTVERVLKNVDRTFFQCTDVASCEAAVDRALRLEPAKPPDAALSDRLLQRLLDGGAEDLAFELIPKGDRLDIRVTYTAAAESQAARETLVQPEYGGKPGREKYYLVIESQPGMDPPKRRKNRKIASPQGWREYWVLPKNTRDVELAQTVSGSVSPLLEMPGLAAALDLDGDAVVAVDPGPAAEPEPTAEPEPVSEPPDDRASTDPAAPRPAPVVPEPAPVVPEPAPAVPEPAPAVPEPAPVEDKVPEPSLPEPEPAPVVVPAPVPEPEPVPEPAVEPEPSPEPAPAPATPEPATAPAPAPAPPVDWPAPDPASPARVYAYDLQLTGPMTLSLAIASSSHLLPRVEVCWQRHSGSGAQQSVLLGALVRGDGFLASTSVTGEITEPGLRDCLNRAVADWSFPAWGNAEQSSDIVLPFVLRMEETNQRRKKRKKR